MKKEYYINLISSSGLKINFIADRLNVNRTMLSRWLHGLDGSKIGKHHVRLLDELLSKYS